MLVAAATTTSRAAAAAFEVGEDGGGGSSNSSSSSSSSRRRTTLLMLAVAGFIATCLVGEFLVRFWVVLIVMIVVMSWRTWDGPPSQARLTESSIPQPSLCTHPHQRCRTWPSC